MASKKKSKNFIAGAIKHPGALHAELHVPADQPIPAKKLAKAENSKNPKERKRAQFAETLEHLSHHRILGKHGKK
jgi:hypothetical protein